MNKEARQKKKMYRLTPFTEDSKPSDNTYRLARFLFKATKLSQKTRRVVTWGRRKRCDSRSDHRRLQVGWQCAGFHRCLFSNYSLTYTTAVYGLLLHFCCVFAIKMTENKYVNFRARFRDTVDKGYHKQAR